MPIEAKASEVRIHARKVRSVNGVSFAFLDFSFGMRNSYLVQDGRVQRSPYSLARGYHIDLRTCYTRIAKTRPRLDLFPGFRSLGFHYSAYP